MFVISSDPKQISQYQETYAQNLPIFEIPQSDSEPSQPYFHKSKKSGKAKKIVSRSFKKGMKNGSKIYDWIEKDIIRPDMIDQSQIYRANQNLN